MHRSDVEHMSSTSTFTRTHTHTRSQASWKTAGLFYPLLFSVRSWVTAIAYQRHTLAQTGSGFISPAALCSGALAAHLPVSPPSERSGALCTRTWAAAGRGVRGRDQTRGVITCYLSITAQVSEIDHSVQAAWGVPLGAQHNKSGDQPGE